MRFNLFSCWSFDIFFFKKMAPLLSQTWIVGFNTIIQIWDSNVRNHCFMAFPLEGKSSDSMISIVWNPNLDNGVDSQNSSQSWKWPLNFSRIQIYETACNKIRNKAVHLYPATFINHSIHYIQIVVIGFKMVSFNLHFEWSSIRFFVDKIHVDLFFRFKKNEWFHNFKMTEKRISPISISLYLKCQWSAWFYYCQHLIFSIVSITIHTLRFFWPVLMIQFTGWINFGCDWEHFSYIHSLRTPRSFM